MRQKMLPPHLTLKKIWYLQKCSLQFLLLPQFGIDIETESLIKWWVYWSVKLPIYLLKFCFLWKLSPYLEVMLNTFIRLNLSGNMREVETKLFFVHVENTFFYIHVLMGIFPIKHDFSLYLIPNLFNILFAAGHTLVQENCLLCYVHRWVHIANIIVGRPKTWQYGIYWFLEDCGCKELTLYWHANGGKNT